MAALLRNTADCILRVSESSSTLILLSPFPFRPVNWLLIYIEQDGLGLGEESVSRFQLHGQAQELRQGDRLT